MPELLKVWVVGDRPSPLKQTLPRFRARIDYALHGEWTAPNRIKVDRDGDIVTDGQGRPKEHILLRRWPYALVTALIACPIALAIDLIDWATFPLGRLAMAIPIVWLIAHIL